MPTIAQFAIVRRLLSGANRWRDFFLSFPLFLKWTIWKGASLIVMRHQISLEVLMIFGTTETSGQSGSKNSYHRSKEMWLNSNHSIYFFGVDVLPLSKDFSFNLFSQRLLPSQKRQFKKWLFFSFLKGAKWILSGIIRCCENDDAAFSLITTQTSLIKATLFWI